jgi:general secretion pathway protein M
VPKIVGEHSIALAALFALLTLCAIVPLWCVIVRSDALNALAKQQTVLERIKVTHLKTIGKTKAGNGLEQAPQSAFLTSQTFGLAGARLEAYLTQLILAQKGSLISSGVHQTDRTAASDIVRVQATLNITYEGLQALLYRLETGTPYVFVDSMTVQPAAQGEQHLAASGIMKVTLDLHSIWRRYPV